MLTQKNIFFKSFYKIGTVFVLLFAMLTNIQQAQAVDFTFSAIDNKNGSMTIKVSGPCVGAFNVSAGNKSAKLAIRELNGSDSTVLKTGAGTFTVKVTAISISDANYNIEENKTKTKIIKVTDKSQSSQNQTNPSNSNHSSSNASNLNKTPSKPKETPTKDNQNTLKSLTASEGKLSPNFQAKETSYSVDVLSDVNKIDIQAVPTSSKAKVTGTGTKELKIGENIFMIKVTAENGLVKTYTISVYVNEKPHIFIDYEGKQYGILNDLGRVDIPKGAVKTTVDYQNNNITVLRKNSVYLVYLQDDNGQNNFYVYDNGKIVGKYKVLKGFDQDYIPVQTNDIPEFLKDLNTKQTMVKIGDVEVQTIKVDSYPYLFVYLMNEDGYTDWYMLDNNSKILLKYTELPIIDTQPKTLQFTQTEKVLLGVSGVLAVFCVAQAIIHYRFKKKSIEYVKNYYEKKQKK